MDYDPTNSLDEYACLYYPVTYSSMCIAGKEWIAFGFWIRLFTNASSEF